MKYAFVALALAATARAQSRSDIPSCAIDCLDSAITSETSCSTTDYVCVCKNFDSLQGSATSCVVKACGADVAVSKFSPLCFHWTSYPGGVFTYTMLTELPRRGPPRCRGSLRCCRQRRQRDHRCC